MKKYFKEVLKYQLRSYPLIKKYVREIEEMYDMEPLLLQERNEERFLYIFKKAYRHSPFYHHLYSTAGINEDDIRCIEDISRLPVITKDLIRQHGNQMRVSRMLLPNHTSGTSGTPLDVWESAESILREQAYFYVYRKRCGFYYGKDRLASLRGNLGREDTTLWVGLAHTLFLSSYNLRKETIDKYVEAIAKVCPKAIEGYPSSLYNLCCLIESEGLSCHIPLCFTSSENLLDYQRDKIAAVLQAEVYDHYGTTERTIRLEETLDHKGYYEDPGYSINEYTVDGEITTSLINSDFPMIRYQTFDLFETTELVVPPSLSDGRHGIFPVVRRIHGRPSSVLVGKDGSIYTNAALTFVISKNTTLEIRYAQFVQHKDGKVDLRVVTDGRILTIEEKKKLLKMIYEKIGRDNIDLEIIQTDESNLIVTDRGKFSYVITEYKQ